jgi:hypothetical protein
VEIRKMMIQGQPKTFARYHLNQRLGMMAHHVPVTPAMWGNTNRRGGFRLTLSIKQDSTSKTTNTKGAGRVAQVVEYLPSKHKVLK